MRQVWWTQSIIKIIKCRFTICLVFTEDCLRVYRRLYWYVYPVLKWWGSHKEFTGELTNECKITGKFTLYKMELSFPKLIHVIQPTKLEKEFPQWFSILMQIRIFQIEWNELEHKKRMLKLSKKNTMKINNFPQQKFSFF